MELKSKMYNILKGNLADEGKYHAIDMIDKHINHASNILELVRDTFPTYTLHNKLHCRNVIEKIEMILGDKINLLTDMEIALLILSAFYHDIGMVYDDDFKRNLHEHPHFASFLEKNPDFALSYYQTSAIDDVTIESFCRVYHAQNSYENVMNMDEQLFFWDNNINLREPVAILCKSHGDYIAELNSREFDTDYVYQADLKFCALMLRLGDVLDFDYTRTPTEFYDYLKLSRKQTAAQKASDSEWQKHLSSNGLFCNDKRTIWNIVAVPKTPKILHDLLVFFKYIEDELQEVNNALKSCSAKKQKISFPLHIDRTKIKNKDFIYGDYRFSISNDNLLDLFMGKNLYIDKYTFIRELIQNAIDTTIQRRLLENNDLIEPIEPEIKISTYFNNEYQTFFCIEDFGMGMDLDIIQNYLLKVGISYYESNRFKALMAKENKRMTAISKFGIGILSCFLIANEIKIYTRYNHTTTTYEIVLDSINGFFAIREVSSKSQYYLNHFGSKIVVSISPSKEDLDFNYEQYIMHITLHSRVNISFNDIRIEQNNDVVDNPWGKYNEEDLNYYKNDILNNLNKMGVSVERMKLKIYPIDITKYSNCKNLRGEGIICQLEVDNLEKLLEQVNSEYEKRLLGIRFDSGKIALYYSYEIDFSHIQENLYRILDRINSINQDLNDYERKFKSIVTENNIRDFYEMHNDKFTDLCEEYFNLYQLKEYYSQNNSKEITNSRYVYFFDKDARNAFSKILRKQGALLSHNGISIKQNICQCISTTYFVIICLAQENNLRPVLGLSRAELISQPWEFYVAYNYAVINAMQQYNFNIEDIHIPFDELFLENWEYGYLCKAMFDKIKDWEKLPIFMFGDKILSINSLPKGKYIQLSLMNLKSYYTKVRFIDVAKSVLLQKSYDITLDTTSGKIMLQSKNETVDRTLLSRSVFPTLFFVNYKNSNALKLQGYPINSQHPFAKWLINYSNYLSENFSELFYRIEQILIDDTTSLRAQKLQKILIRIKHLDQNCHLLSIPEILDNDFK